MQIDLFQPQPIQYVLLKNDEIFLTELDFEDAEVLLKWYSRLSKNDTFKISKWTNNNYLNY